MFIELVMLSNHLIYCHPLLLMPSIFPSIRVFSNESALRISWPKYWSFSFQHQSFQWRSDHPGLISFKMDWLDLLAVQGTLKSLLQRYSSKTSILWCSAFFTVQLSHPYTTTGKTIALTRRTFVGKVMCIIDLNITQKNVCWNLLWWLSIRFLFFVNQSIFVLCVWGNTVEYVLWIVPLTILLQSSFSLKLLLAVKFTLFDVISDINFV